MWDFYSEHLSFCLGMGCSLHITLMEVSSHMLRQLLGMFLTVLLGMHFFPSDWSHQQVEPKGTREALNNPGPIDPRESPEFHGSEGKILTERVWTRWTLLFWLKIHFFGETSHGFMVNLPSFSGQWWSNPSLLLIEWCWLQGICLPDSPNAWHRCKNEAEKWIVFFAWYQ